MVTVGGIAVEIVMRQEIHKQPFILKIQKLCGFSCYLNENNFISLLFFSIQKHIFYYLWPPDNYWD